MSEHPDRRRVLAVRGGAVVAIVAFGIAGCGASGGSGVVGGGGGQPAGTGTATSPASLRVPSVAELLRYAPGGVDSSSSMDRSSGAPLMCGGTHGGRLGAAAVVSVTATLSRLSVLRYDFDSAAGVDAYFAALSQASQVRAGQCRVTAADHSVFSAVSLVAAPNLPQAEGSGTTTFPSGPYGGALQYNVIRYQRQGSAVFVIRIDRMNGYPAERFLDAVTALMRAPLGVQPTARPTPGATVLTGTLTRANWDSSIASGTGVSSQFVLTQMMTCPQFVASGATSTLGFIEQLPNAGPDGLVVLDANGMPTTIRWGTKVTAVTDPAAGPANLRCSSDVRYLAVLSVTAAPA